MSDEFLAFLNVWSFVYYLSALQYLHTDTKYAYTVQLVCVFLLYFQVAIVFLVDW